MDLHLAPRVLSSESRLYYPSAFESLPALDLADIDTEWVSVVMVM